jgi:hypothetical protein
MENAGRLEPGAAYVYEREGGRVYARRVGTLERTLIGEDFLEDIQARRQKLAREWEPIVLAAEQNPALQEAIDRVKVLYELSRQDEPIAHHPV